MVSKALKSLQFPVKSETSRDSQAYLVQQLTRCWASWLRTGLLKTIIKTIKTKQKAEYRSISVGMAYELWWGIRFHRANKNDWLSPQKNAQILSISHMI